MLKNFCTDVGSWINIVVSLTCTVCCYAAFKIIPELERFNQRRK
jgi:hypothetical protein